MNEIIEVKAENERRAQDYYKRKQGK